jgi:anti-sigma factor RsiW
MTVDDTMLMAYVDGDLPPERRAEVDAAVAHSPELAMRLRFMRSSVLPYGAAFDRQALPPVPTALTERVAELALVSSHVRAEPVARRMAWPRLAAAFLVGVVTCAAAVKLWSVHGGQTVAVASATTRMDPWIQAVADYQVLYSRKTLQDVKEDPALSAKIVGDLNRDDGMALRIPDLSSAGLTYKRVQRLNFHGQAVAQIVYLPAHGDPIALCVTRDVRSDTGPAAPQNVGEMRAVAWHHDNLGYVLLGKDPSVDLGAIASRIASAEAGALYGKRVAPVERGADMRRG